VGHTTNFVQRKHAHKQNCLNEKAANHTCKLYEVIRANGNWANWQMEIINFFNCADHYAARKKEQEYFIALNATLNSIEPLPKPKIALVPAIATKKPKQVFFCTTCNINCDSSNTFDTHTKTTKHKKLAQHTVLLNSNVPNLNVPKNPPLFTCPNCDYNTTNKKDFKKHEETIKHKHKLNPNDTYLKNPIVIYQCKCGKKYKHNSTLSTHKKNCNYTTSLPQIIPLPSDVNFLTNLVLEVVKNNNELQKQTSEVHKQNAELQKQNQEFQKQMMEVCKNGNTTINNSNSNNKTFNLQVFLNEKCKDAMNIMDFVNSMTLELSDLEDVGNLGYVEGISKIMIRKLNEMDVYKRPIHCSDAKREIMYVRDENVWSKENSTYDKLRKAIKHVSHKNSCLLGPWSKAYPDCMNNQHRLNDVYIQLIGQAMGGRAEFVDSENKIMKKIAKSVLIDKNC
jgi:hypothetical protein